MLNKTRLVVALLAAGGATAGVLLASTGGASAGPGITTLTYSIKDTSNVFTETGKSGIVPGAEIAIAGNVYASSTRVGSYIVNCTVDIGTELNCRGTSWIGSGVNQLTFAGYLNAGSVKNVVTVTGGSGRYFGMTGQLFIDFTNSNQSAANITFQLES